MVRERVPWAVFENGFALRRPRRFRPTKPDEEVRDRTTCPGCRSVLAVTVREWRGRTCSERCEQRVRRAERKAYQPQAWQTGQACGVAFQARAGARFCSSACRQRAY